MSLQRLHSSLPARHSPAIRPLPSGRLGGGFPSVGWELSLRWVGAVFSFHLYRVIRLVLRVCQLVALLVADLHFYVWVRGDIPHRVGEVAAAYAFKLLAADGLVLSTFIIYRCRRSYFRHAGGVEHIMPLRVVGAQDESGQAAELPRPGGPFRTSQAARSCLPWGNSCTTAT